MGGGKQAKFWTVCEKVKNYNKKSAKMTIGKETFKKKIYEKLKKNTLCFTTGFLNFFFLSSICVSHAK